MKKHANARDYSHHMPKVGDDKLMSNSVNSVHDFNGTSKKEGDMQHLGAIHDHNKHSKSLMKGTSEDLAFIDKRKEILDKKRNEQMNKNYNHISSKAGQMMLNMTGTNQRLNDH